MPRGSSSAGAPICAVILGCERIVEVHHHQPPVAKHVSVGSNESNAASAVQCAVGIEGQRPLEEVVCWDRHRAA